MNVNLDDFLFRNIWLKTVLITLISMLLFHCLKTKNNSNSSPEQCATCKRSLKASWGLNQHGHVCKEKQVIYAKVVETTSATFFLIKNVTVDKDNIWNADSDVMKNKFNDLYNMVVHWRKPLFLLPSGSSGKRFIEKLTRLINSWAYRSEQDTIAMKALMVLPTLLLQKTSFTSKSKDNVQTLKRRLRVRWANRQCKIGK